MNIHFENVYTVNEMAKIKGSNRGIKKQIKISKKYLHNYNLLMYNYAHGE